MAADVGITDATQLARYLRTLGANSFTNLVALAESQGIDVNKNQIKALREMGYSNVYEVVKAFGITDIQQFLNMFGLSSVPHAAHGAIVKARPGGRILNIAEAGTDEAVLPLSGPGIGLLRQALGSGRPQTITVVVELDGREIARAVEAPLVDLIRLRTGLRI